MINRSTVEKEQKKDVLDDNEVKKIIKKVEESAEGKLEDEVIEHNESGRDQDFFAV